MALSPSLTSTTRLTTTTSPLSPRLFLSLKPPLPTLSLRRRSLPAIKTSVRGSSSSAVMTMEEEEEAAAEKKIGARVRVTADLKVYHVAKAPEISLAGREGKLKSYVASWKGKRISANYPFKIEFIAEVEGKGSVKFFAHLREDEFEYID